jgi:hypothetical protein
VQVCQAAAQSALHRHWTDLQGLTGAPVAPASQDNPLQHRPLAALQLAQKLANLHISLLCGAVGWSGRQTVRALWFEQQLIQAHRPAVQAALLQALPLDCVEAHRFAQLLSGWRLGRLPTQLGQLMLLLLKPPRQTHNRGRVSQVVKDGSPDVGSGKGVEGGLALAAVELGGPQQSQQSHLHQVVEGFGTALAVVQGNRAHQLLVLLDPGIALLERSGQAALAASGVAGGRTACAWTGDGVGHDKWAGAEPCSFFSKQLQRCCSAQP